MATEFQTTFSTLGYVVAVGSPIVVVWWSTRWIPKRWARIYSRVVLMPIVVLVFAPLLRVMISGPVEGDWQCLVCGAQEHRVSYYDFALTRESVVDPPIHRDRREFERWYWREIGAAHDHDWISVGCHYGASFVACSFEPGASYYDALPTLPDSQLAISMARKVLRAEPERRGRMIRGLDRFSETPFRSIASGERMTADEFEREYESWIAQHPEWQ